MDETSWHNLDEALANTRLVVSSESDSLSVVNAAVNSLAGTLCASTIISRQIADSVNVSGVADSFVLCNRLVDSVNVSGVADSAALSNRLVNSVNISGVADSFALSNRLVDSVNASVLPDSAALSNRLVDSVNAFGLEDSISFSGRLADGLSMSPNPLIQTWEKPVLVSEHVTDFHGGMDDELWTALGDLGDHLQQMLEGAWNTLIGRGPDSHRQAAHSMRELIDWVLRSLAPDSAFESAELLRMGLNRPTRRMRLERILRPHAGKKTLQRASRHLESTHGGLDAVAHTGTGSAWHIRGLLRSSEGILLIICGRRRAS